ncbi:hypothetical protein ABZV91_29155 [Nocardia sp. NPDC004568]|uniref:hypothetical protein n=1 Tax=Nocardia sp. NPDC004568 TaxID=3154551 RepID=UPI0033A8F6FA
MLLAEPTDHLDIAHQLDILEIVVAATITVDGVSRSSITPPGVTPLNCAASV